MISRESIDEILLRNDIESLISSYIPLKRAGSNLKGLCPFHNEKTPSFMVYPADNSFFCFGCGVGGNAITFIRQMERLDYPDAVEFLARRAGITIVRDDDREQYRKKTSISKERLRQMNVDAAKFFHAMLFANNSDSKEALAYFTEKRKLSIATIKHFGLGYAPNSFDATMKYLLSKGYTREEMAEGFLAMKNEKGKYYDAFRNRVMFPIIDTAGNVIAFGGRVLDDSKPKYRNSTDTPVFKKSYNLFALNFARMTCSEEIILCEGYMDVIALHAAGFTNAVATLGTAITAEQARMMSRYTKKVIISYDADEAGQKAAMRAIKMLTEVGLDVTILKKRYTKKVIICYDADEAGQKATQKAMRLLEEVGLNVTVIKIPGSKDPDEYIKTFGNEKFKEVIAGSKTRFEYQLDNILSRFDINIPQDKINALKETENLISTVYSKAEQDIYINSVCKIFDVKYENIRQDIDKIVRKKQFASKKEETEKIKNSKIGYADRVNPDYAKAPEVAGNEENVLGLLLIYPEHRKKVIDENIITRDDFFTDFGKRVFDYAMMLEGEGSPEDINLLFSEAEVGRITKIKYSRMNLTDNGDSALLESIEMLKNSVNKKNAKNLSSISELDKLLNSIRNKEKDGN